MNNKGSKKQPVKPKPYCFVSYSNWEPQAQLVIACLNILFKDRYDIHYTPSALESGGGQYDQITNLIKNCAFGVVILDGFRPNVIWEYGVMVGCNRELILIMGNGATVDMSMYDESTPETPGIAAVPIKMDKHLSDVKDRFRTGCDLSKFAEVLEILTEEAKKKNLLV